MEKIEPEAPTRSCSLLSLSLSLWRLHLTAAVLRHVARAFRMQMYGISPPKHSKKNNRTGRFSLSFISERYSENAIAAERKEMGCSEQSSASPIACCTKPAFVFLLGESTVDARKARVERCEALRKHRGPLQSHTLIQYKLALIHAGCWETRLRETTRDNTPIRK